MVAYDDNSPSCQCLCTHPECPPFFSPPLSSPQPPSTPVLSLIHSLIHRGKLPLGSFVISTLVCSHSTCLYFCYNTYIVHYIAQRLLIPSTPWDTGRKGHWFLKLLPLWLAQRHGQLKANTQWRQAALYKCKWANKEMKLLCKQGPCCWQK